MSDFSQWVEYNNQLASKWDLSQIMRRVGHRLRRHWKGLVLLYAPFLLLSLISVIPLVFGGTYWSPHPFGPPGFHLMGFCAVVAFLAPALLFLGFMAWIIFMIVDSGFNALRVADQLNLSPAEVELALWREWGRQPTVQEIQAVHQMVNAERNKALLTAGVSLGSIFLLHDAVSRSRGL